MAEPKQKRKHFFARNAVRDIPFPAYRMLKLIMMTLRRTWRAKIDDPEHLLAESVRKPVIFACWHNRLLLTPTIVPSPIRKNTAGLASASRDGEYAAQLMRAFGMPMVRGSTSRGGFRALVGLRRQLREGHSIALTPDGPRGPRYEVQPGIVILAERTGSDILPVSLNSHKHWELKGWDKTQIPKPFTNVAFVVGKPLSIPPDLSPEQREEECRRVRDAMMNITED